MPFRFMFFALMLSFAFVVDKAPAGQDEKPNCRLMVQTFYKDGGKKLNVDMVFAPTREACKSEAMTREVDSREDDDVSNVKVRFGYRGPTIDPILEHSGQDVMKGSF